METTELMQAVAGMFAAHYVTTKATGPKLLPPLITFRGNSTRATRIHTKDTVRQQMLSLGVCYIHKGGSFARICCIYVCNFLILQYSLSFRSFILYLCQQWLCHLSLFFCVFCLN